MHVPYTPDAFDREIVHRGGWPEQRAGEQHIIYRGGPFNESTDLTREINRRVRTACILLKQYSQERRYRPATTLVTVDLKSQTLKAKVVKLVLYGCIT